MTHLVARSIQAANPGDVMDQAARSFGALRAWLADEFHKALVDEMDDMFLATEKGMQYQRRSPLDAR